MVGVGWDEKKVMVRLVPCHDDKREKRKEKREGGRDVRHQMFHFLVHVAHLAGKVTIGGGGGGQLFF